MSAPSVKRAVKRIAEALDRETLDLTPDDYREVLDEIETEVQARRDALDEERKT